MMINKVTSYPAKMFGTSSFETANQNPIKVPKDIETR